MKTRSSFLENVFKLPRNNNVVGTRIVRRKSAHCGCHREKPVFALDRHTRSHIKRLVKISARIRRIFVKRFNAQTETFNERIRSRKGTRISFFRSPTILFVIFRANNLNAWCRNDNQIAVEKIFFKIDPQRNQRIREPPTGRNPPKRKSRPPQVPHRALPFLAKATDTLLQQKRL